MDTKPGTTNLDVIQTKYLERNPIARYANQIFLKTIDHYLSALEYSSLLDAGCGEGIVLDRLPPSSIVHSHIGLDLDYGRLLQAAQRQVGGLLACASISDLPMKDNCVDLVLALEVLEHVAEPELALKELLRVSKKYILVSVPHEPFWRMANMARLKYLRDWGNTPEHINHWTLAGFRKFVSRVADIQEVKTPFLWTFILATPIR